LLSSADLLLMIVSTSLLLHRVNGMFLDSDRGSFSSLSKFCFTVIGGIGHPNSAIYLRFWIKMCFVLCCHSYTSFFIHEWRRVGMGNIF